MTRQLIAKKIIMIKCIFNFLLIAIVFSSVTQVHSFEYLEYEKKIKTSYNLRNTIEKMPRRDLEKSLRDFVANTRPGRLVGSPGHKKAQEYLENKLKSLSSTNVNFKKIEFTGILENKKEEKGVNFIAFFFKKCRGH